MEGKSPDVPDLWGRRGKVRLTRQSLVMMEVGGGLDEGPRENCDLPGEVGKWFTRQGGRVGAETGT